MLKLIFPFSFQLHIDRDAPVPFSFTPLTPMPDGPIEVPENAPVGTFLLSVDFNAAPPLAEFQVNLNQYFSAQKYLFKF